MMGLGALALVAAVGTAASAGVSAYGQREAGIAQARQARAQANVEKLKANQEQINMRQRMMAALASQNDATKGAVSTGIASGFGANAMRQIKQNQNDLMISRANASGQISLLDQQAANASAAGSLAAAGDVVGGAVKVSDVLRNPS